LASIKSKRVLKYNPISCSKGWKKR
jgi:hypothetical protein